MFATLVFVSMWWTAKSIGKHINQKEHTVVHQVYVCVCACTHLDAAATRRLLRKRSGSVVEAIFKKSIESAKQMIQ